MCNCKAHARYLIWSARAVGIANETWRSRHPYLGETLLDRVSLHSHLFHWGVAEGLIPDPSPRGMPYSYYVALAFRKDPEAVKTQARAYWRTMTKQRSLHA